MVYNDLLKAIERENGILLGKLSRIAARKGPEGSGMDRAHRALHPGEVRQPSKRELAHAHTLVVVLCHDRSAAPAQRDGS